MLLCCFALKLSLVLGHRTLFHLCVTLSKLFFFNIAKLFFNFINKLKNICHALRLCAQLLASICCAFVPHTCLKSKGFLVHIFYEIYSYCKGYEELVDLNIWLLRSADCCYGWKFVEPACKQFIAWFHNNSISNDYKS